MKLTKRKSFSFYRSYYDVFNELPEKHQLEFIKYLLDKQFLDEDPKEMNGLVKFAYISQMDSIEKQVKGYCDKTKIALNPNKSYPWQGVGAYPRQGVANTPRQQEKEKEKEKEEYITKEVFIKLWNETRTDILKKPSHLNRVNLTDLKNLNGYTQDEVRHALRGFFRQNTFPNGQDYTTNTKHFLERIEIYKQAYHDKNPNLYGKDAKH